MSQENIRRDRQPQNDSNLVKKQKKKKRPKPVPRDPTLFYEGAKRDRSEIIAKLRPLEPPNKKIKRILKQMKSSESRRDEEKAAHFKRKAGNSLDPKVVDYMKSYSTADGNFAAPTVYHPEPFRDDKLCFRQKVKVDESRAAENEHKVKVGKRNILAGGRGRGKGQCEYFNQPIYLRK